jgi:hypothetical protein
MSVMLHRTFVIACVAILALLVSAQPSEAAKIEAIKGKRYSLSKQHGPWMIMVTTMSGATREQHERAQKAADELVYELRQLGIPAYVYALESKIERVSTLNRMGQEDRRIYAAQRSDIGVLAGNYDDIENATAQKTLKYLKDYRPKTLQAAGLKKGQPSGPGPLNKAFLTTNPMLSPEELARMTQSKDPLLARLNSGVEFSLASNPGKYSLIVASFYGSSQIKPTRFAEFDKKLAANNVSLDNAGHDAWQLARAMRQQGIEAYLYHDRYRSIVTVGAFASPKDPALEKQRQAFSAKYKKNPETGKDVLVAESIQIGGGNGRAPIKSWVMDPHPQPIEVPRFVKK